MTKPEAAKLIYKYKLTTYLVPQEDGMYITYNDTVGLDVANMPLYLYWDKVNMKVKISSIVKAISGLVLWGIPIGIVVGEQISSSHYDSLVLIIIGIALSPILLILVVPLIKEINAAKN